MIPEIVRKQLHVQKRTSRSSWVTLYCTGSKFMFRKKIRLGNRQPFQKSITIPPVELPGLDTVQRHLRLGLSQSPAHCRYAQVRPWVSLTASQYSVLEKRFTTYAYNVYIYIYTYKYRSIIRKVYIYIHIFTIICIYIYTNIFLLHVLIHIYIIFVNVSIPLLYIYIYVYTTISIVLFLFYVSIVIQRE